MKKTSYIIILILFTQLLYSQSEYEYFEKQRLESKDKKIKIISTYDCLDDLLWYKEYYNENGFLIKKEIFTHNNESNKLTLYQKINIDSYDASGNISGTEILYETDGSILNENHFSKLNFTYFYEIGFDENITEEIEYIFDNQNQLIEKRFYYEDVNGYIYDKELLFYNTEGKNCESKHFFSGSSNVSISKFYYNSLGLLEKKETLDGFYVKTGGIKYNYEFYE
jgi:hypothetical protein